MKTGKARWLLLMYSLPARASKERVDLWRKLRQLGAVALKNSVYILPHRDEFYENFQWLAQEIQSVQGEATLVKVERIENMKDKEIVALFHRAREEDYRQITAECKGLIERLDGLSGEEPLEEKRGLEKISRRMEEVEGIDFFRAPSGKESRALLKKARERLEGIVKDSSKVLKKPVPLDRKIFSRKTWFTRKRPHVDRLSSAWLIKRFIDPEARFVFVSEGEVPPDGVAFDMAGAELSHHGEDCTFETIVKAFGIRDRAVREMAQIVHDVDLRDGKFGRLEVKGLDAVLRGLLETYQDDHALLEAGFTVFEALYKFLQK